MKIEELYDIILNRKKSLPVYSYIASLFKKGKDRVIQKVGEESIEVILAAKNEKKEEIIYEIADLWFHLLIMMVAFSISPQDIFNELENRNQSNEKRCSCEQSDIICQ